MQKMRNVPVAESWQDIFQTISGEEIIIVAGAAGGTGGAAPYLAQKLLDSGKSVSVCLSSALPVESGNIHTMASQTIKGVHSMADRLEKIFVFYPEKASQLWMRSQAFAKILDDYGADIINVVIDYYKKRER